MPQRGTDAIGRACRFIALDLTRRKAHIRKRGEMVTMEGTLHLDLLSDKSVRLLFMPRTKGRNSRPLAIPNTGQARSDLESFWGFAPAALHI